MSLTVNKLLKKQKPLCCLASDSLETVYKRMIQEGVHRFPVVNSREELLLEGIVSVRDMRVKLNCPLVKATSVMDDMISHMREFSQIRNKKVSDCMTQKVVSIPASATVREAAVKLRDLDLRGIPVVEEVAEGKLKVVGMITRTDVLNLFILQDIEMEALQQRARSAQVGSTERELGISKGAKGGEQEHKESHSQHHHHHHHSHRSQRGSDDASKEKQHKHHHVHHKHTHQRQLNEEKTALKDDSNASTVENARPAGNEGSV